MNTTAGVLLGIGGASILFAPKKSAAVVFTAFCCYLGYGRGLELGSLSVQLVRIVILCGLLKALSQRFRLPGGIVALDWIVIAWGGWAVVSCVFHTDIRADLIGKLGAVYDTCGAYFTLRVLCGKIESVQELSRMLALMILPIVCAMAYEYSTMHNIFGDIGAGASTPMVRDGRIRTYGPFQHPILAGTVAGTLFPLFAGLALRKSPFGALGLICSSVMIYTSGSSGPIMSAVAGLAALILYPLRHRIKALQWSAIGGYVLLDLVMKAPAYYLLGRIDLTGSSTGYHRAALIEASIKHLNEWWKGGTDYTRHWMPTGVSWSENHTDITNHYIHMGVIGGLPLLMLFCWLILRAFTYVGDLVQRRDTSTSDVAFESWMLGSWLFSHAVTFLSVRYFDQSFILVYLTIAAIAACRFGQSYTKGEHLAEVKSATATRWYGEPNSLDKTRLGEAAIACGWFRGN